MCANAAPGHRRARWARLRRGLPAAWFVRAAWILGYLIGTSTHLIDLVLGGTQVYAAFPLELRLFWISLTVFDPLVVILLVLRNKAGIALGVAVIVSDIAVNWTVYVTTDGQPLFGVINQTAFAILILSTARQLWKWFDERPRSAGCQGSAV